MTSIDFNTPPRNVTLMALSAVIGLHVLAAVALVTMKPSIPVDNIIKASTPIEIQMLTLPMEKEKPEPIEIKERPPEIEETPVEVKVNIEPELNPEMMVSHQAFEPTQPIKTVEPLKPENESVAIEPIVEPLPKVENEPKPVEPKPETQKLETRKAVRATPQEQVVAPETIIKETFIEETFIEEIVVEQPLIEKTVKPEVPTINQNIIAAQALAAKQQQIAAAQNAQRAAEAAANRKAQQEAAQAQAQKEAKIREQQVAAQAAKQAEKAAQEKAAQQAQAARDAEVAAKADAQAKADAKAKADAAKAEAASNTPMNFTASGANWRSQPNFNFPDRAARSANSGDTFNVVLLLRVNKQGGIDSVSLAKSSGNAILDREAQRQVRSGKFKPFTNDAGLPVVGNVTLPVSYVVP